MSKQHRDIELFIVDIFVSLQKIETYLINFDNKEEFRQDSLHWDATIRQLEIIGEALNKLLNNEDFSRLSPKYFRKVVNFRHVIVHGYFGIDLDEVWDVLTEKIILLKKDMDIIVKGNIDLSEAVSLEIDHYRDLKDTRIVEYLEEMQKKYS